MVLLQEFITMHGHLNVKLFCCIVSFSCVVYSSFSAVLCSTASFNGTWRIFAHGGYRYRS